jgi:hypothetical protein
VSRRAAFFYLQGEAETAFSARDFPSDERSLLEIATEMQSFVEAFRSPSIWYNFAFPIIYENSLIQSKEMLNVG